MNGSNVVNFCRDYLIYWMWSSRFAKVASDINYVANDDAECSAPVALTETQAGIFS
jgi:hypothetical protein